MKKFEIVSDNEMVLIDGGGLAGAAAGYIVGVAVGGIAAAVCYCQTKGDAKQNTAVMTTFTSAVISCTAIGAAATGIF